MLPAFWRCKRICDTYRRDVAIEISIGNKTYSRKRCLLELPAENSAIEAAFDGIGLPHDSNDYVIRTERVLDNLSFLGKLLLSDIPPSLVELNTLAATMEQSDRHGFNKLDAIMKQQGSCNISTAINSAANMDKYSFYPGISTYEELGAHALENDIYPELKSLPLDFVECIDIGKLGKKFCRDDSGLLTKAGYLVREFEGWDIVYNGELADSALEMDCEYEIEPTMGNI